MKWFRRKPENKPMRFVLAWCDCGAPMAFDDAARRADCADIMRGIAIPTGEPGSLWHSDMMPYVFWKLRAAEPNIEIRRDPRNQPCPTCGSRDRDKRQHVGGGGVPCDDSWHVGGAGQQDTERTKP